MGRPTIHAKAMTPAERKRRSRDKAREVEIRASRAKASLAPPPRKVRVESSRVGHSAIHKAMLIERQAYVTLLGPVNELAKIAETDGKVTELLEQMSPVQRANFGRCARCAMKVVEILTTIPDDATE